MYNLGSHLRFWPQSLQAQKDRLYLQETYERKESATKLVAFRQLSGPGSGRRFEGGMRMRIARFQFREKRPNLFTAAAQGQAIAALCRLDVA